MVNHFNFGVTKEAQHLSQGKFMPELILDTILVFTILDTMYVNLPIQIIQIKNDHATQRSRNFMFGLFE